jgi:hypothetical protein
MNTTSGPQAHAFYIGLQADNDAHALQRLYTRYGFSPAQLRVIHSVNLDGTSEAWHIVACPEITRIPINRNWELLHSVWNLTTFPNLPYVDLEDIRL